MEKTKISFAAVYQDPLLLLCAVVLLFQRTNSLIRSYFLRFSLKDKCKKIQRGMNTPKTHTSTLLHIRTLPLIELLSIDPFFFVLLSLERDGLIDEFYCERALRRHSVQ